MYTVIFHRGTEVVAEWKGYESYAAARRAIIDADQLIPFNLEYFIIEEPDQ